MKIYVAAKFEEGPLAHETMEKLKSMGHLITHDWTKENDSGLSGAELAKYRNKCAMADVNGVRDADLLFLINHPNGKGMFTELGIALAHKKPVIVVDRSKANNIFLHITEPGESTVVEVMTVDEGLRMVDAYQRIIVPALHKPTYRGLDELIKTPRKDVIGG